MRRATVALGTGLAALGVYVLTLCPDVYVEGTGELIGATYLLGTPHPTGYPLYAVWGRLFAAAVPVGSVAWRVNLFTACTAAAAAAGLAALLMGRGLRWPAAAAAGLCLAWGATFWSQAVIAEVYGLSVLAAIGVIGVGLAAVERRDQRLALLGGFAAGLGATTHLNQLLVWPGLLLWGLWRWPELRRPGLLGGIGTAVLAGYSLVLYLPLRNGLGEGFHWAAVGRPDLLWDHLSGALYRSAFFGLEAHLVWLNAQRWAAQMVADYQPLLLPVVGLGLWLAWRRDRGLWWVMTAAVAFNLLMALNYRRDPNGLGVFFLLSLLGAAVFMAYGLDEMARRLKGRGWVVLAVPLVVLAHNWHSADRSGNWIPRQSGADILAGLPPGAVLFTEGDDTAFILDYLHRVEGQRPDILLYNRMGRGYDLLDQTERALPPLVQGRLRRQREAQLIQAGERPVFFQVARKSLLPLAGYDFVPDGLLYRLVPAGTEGGRTLLPPMENAQRANVFRDPWVRKLQANYWFMLGEHRRAAGDKQAAATAYQKAAEVAYDSWTTRFNAAVSLLRLQRPEAALPHLEAAVQLDPTRVQAARLLAQIRRRGSR